MHGTKTLAALLVLGLAEPALAEEFTTVRGLGMGNALTATAAGASSLFVNPAGMSLTRAYSIEASYQYQVQRQGHFAHVSVVDSLNSPRVHAGIFYNFYQAGPEVFDPVLGRSLRLTKQAHETGLAISVPIGTWLAIGAQARYVYYHTTTKAPSPDNPEEETESDVEKLNTFGLDAGIVVTALRPFVFGLAARNLVPTHSHEAPLSMSIGAAYSFGKLLVADIDLTLRFDTPEEKQMVGARAGLELFLKNMLAVRAGTWYEGWPEAVYVTAGLGYVNPRAAVEIGFAQQVDGGVETRFGLSVRIFLFTNQ